MKNNVSVIVEVRKVKHRWFGLTLGDWFLGFVLTSPDPDKPVESTEGRPWEEAG